MYCRNCGSALSEGQSFCPNCGTKKIEENTNENVAQQSFDNNTLPVMELENINNSTPLKNQNGKKKKPFIILLTIIGVPFAIIVLFFIIKFWIISESSSKLVCTSPEGNITIMHNDETLLSYKAYDITYDLNQQKEYAEEVGIDAYLSEFNDWFEKNTTGTCVRNGGQDASSTHDNEKNTTNKTEILTENGKLIGDKKYGYLTVPNSWVEFHDVDGNTSLQYSYAGVYIVTMDYVRDNTKHTAKEYAQSYMYQKKQDTTVSGVTGGTVKIGKNDEYTAYQVYMYYPQDGTYLVTYWFETEDGVIRYLALEGPMEVSGTKITDYLHIPESFTLNK